MNAHPRDDFEDTDTICLTCLIDEHLRQLAHPRSQPAECSVCGAASSPSILVGDLAEIVDTAVRQHFRWGDELPRDGWVDRRGYDLSELWDVVLPAGFPIPRTLQRAIGDRDADPRDGGEPFWSDDMRYQEDPPSLEAEREEWDGVAAELKTQRRFFSRRAEEFFRWLFEDLDDLQSPDGGVALTVEAGNTLFRARRWDLWTEAELIAGDPARELGPPPVRLAAENRMSPKGVPVFYGALELPTCIAELRAPLGGQVAVGRFSLTQNVKLLDFRRLEKARSRTRPSIFRSDYARAIGRRRFTAVVHQLVRTPVVPDHESEYLITQAMAEYLAHMHEHRFDGLLYGSAQADTGTNVVLFNPKPLVRYVPDSLTFHQVTHVKYSSKEMQLIRVGGKPGFLFDPMAVFEP